MAINRNPPSDFSMEQAMAFAASPAGKQLLAILQKQNRDELNIAQQSAASGDMDAAKKALSSLLTDPQIQKLLKQFGK